MVQIWRGGLIDDFHSIIIYFIEARLIDTLFWKGRLGAEIELAFGKDLRNEVVVA